MTAVFPLGEMPMPADFAYRDVLRKGRPRHDAPYDAFSVRHPAMDPGRRAKLFAPFDALAGFREQIAAQEDEEEEGAPRACEPGEAPGNEEGLLMCSRYFVELSPELRSIIEEAERAALTARMTGRLARSLKTGGEVRPSDIAPVIAPGRTGSRAVFPMIWGFSPFRGKSLLINARVETAGKKPTFRESWLRHRCVIPASYYFEWEHLLSPDGAKAVGRKYMIQPRGSSVTWLAGLYRLESDGFPHFTILTREPAESIRFLHDRMPLILPVQSLNAWINPLTGLDQVQQIAAQAVTDLQYEAAG